MYFNLDDGPAGPRSFILGVVLVNALLRIRARATEDGVGFLALARRPERGSFGLGLKASAP